MATVWSEHALAVMKAATVRPWRRASSSDLPLLRDFEASLFDATGGRGMPVLAGVVWGQARALEAGEDVAPELPDEGVLIAWSNDGPLYLTPQGSLLHSELGIIAGSAVAEVERLAWTQGPWASESLAIYPPIGHALSTELGVPWLEEASDDARFGYVNDDYLLIDEDQLTRLWARDRPRLARALKLCHTAGASVEVHSDAPRRSSERDLRVPVRPADYERAADGSDLTLRIWCDETRVVLRSTRTDTVIDERLFGDEAVVGRPSIRASRIMGGSLSARAAHHLDATGIVRQPDLHCSAARLRSELERRGLAVSDALVWLEERFGGLVLPTQGDGFRISELMFGVYQMLTAPPALRGRLRFDGQEEPDLAPTVWPQMRYGHDVLTLVGLELFEERLYCDGRGAIYRYVGEIDLFTVDAGSATAFFELKALRAHLRQTIRDLAWLRVDAMLGEQIADELRLGRVAEVSDYVATHWLGERLWLWQQTGYGPNGPATFLVSATPELMVAGAERMLQLAPGASGLKLQTSGLGGAARLVALQAAGLPVSG